MTKKKSFLIYYDQQEVIDKLKDEEAGRIFKDLFRYGSQNIVPDYGDNRLMSVVFLVLKTAIDRDAEKYEATCKKNRENSKKRWRQENASNEGVRADASAYEGNREKPVVTDLMQSNPKDADSDRDIDRDKEIDRDIEAKAIHKDIPSVIDYQCKEYSRNIRSEDKSYQIGIWGNYKVPFTFATNGRPYLEQYDTKSGVWFLDLRLPYNAPKALHGWISPTGIMELLEKDIAAGNQGLIEMPYDLLRDKDGLNLREYQLKAIRAAEQAIIDGQQNILLAMATGTGKTRTVLGMIYRFLKTGRFRRILFLV